MKTASVCIEVHASHTYAVKIGAGLLDTLGAECAAAVRGHRVVIVTDSNLAPLYLDRAARSLKEAGFTVSDFIFPAGESSKTTKTFAAVLDCFAAAGLTRADAAVALGGGVTGDLCGFSAACYLRGIDFIQVPTSLLAMTDSSVGGKTGVDLPAGKNLCGAFHQPALVLCDTDLLSTLPAQFFADGMAEVIKYGVIRDASLFALLEQGDIGAHLQEVIARCVTIKRDIVEADEFDRGTRQLLNFGHTAAHGVEQVSGFSVSHGHAVAIGMVLAANAAGQKEIAKRIAACCAKYALETRCPYDAKALLPACTHDKKIQSETITVVEPEKLGYCVTRALPLGELEDWLTRGTAQ